MKNSILFKGISLDEKSYNTLKERYRYLNGKDKVFLTKYEVVIRVGQDVNRLIPYPYKAHKLMKGCWWFLKKEGRYFWLIGFTVAIIALLKG